MELAWIALCLGFSVFFSASEAALLSLRPSDFAGWRNKRVSHRITYLLSNPRTLYIMVFLCNLLANSAAAMLAMSLLVRRQVPTVTASVITVIAMTGLITLCGEIIPKTFATKYGHSTASMIATPLYYLYLLLWPVLELADRFNNAIIGTLEKQVSRRREGLTEEELRTYLTKGQREGGLIGTDAEAMIHGVFDFTDRMVRQVMCPRRDITAIPLDMPMEKVLDVIQESDCSRIPVHQGDLDEIVGILYTKDVIAALATRSEAPRSSSSSSPSSSSSSSLSASPDSPGADLDLRPLLREPFYVPEVMKVSYLLKEFQVRKLHMAVVVDEYGGSAGLVTMDDLLEEIFGEIPDEDEEEARPVVKVAEGEWIVEAGMEIGEVEDLLGIVIPDDECETIGGFLFTRVGHFPVVGEDRLDYSGYRFEVAEAEHHRIQKLHIRRNEGGAS